MRTTAFNTRAMGMTAMTAMVFSAMGVAAAQSTPPNEPPGRTPPPPPGQTPPRQPPDTSPPMTPPKQTPPSTMPPRSPETDVARGFLSMPPGAEALATEMAPYSIQMFMDDNFKGTELTLTGIDTSAKAGALNEFTKGLNDSMSSVRWSLPAGLVAVLYEDASGKGEQLVLWGSGQFADLDSVDYNDKGSRWAWYDLGGGTTSPRSTGANLPPQGSEIPDTTVPENTIQFHIDKNFRDDMEQISPVTGQMAGARQQIPAKMKDTLTSLRWNLPPGVIVMLYQDADGGKQQVALWGHGQYKDLDLVDFNDKASRWSWSYLGTAPTMKPTPPAKPTPPPATPPPSDRRPAPQQPAPPPPSIPPSTNPPSNPR